MSSPRGNLPEQRLPYELGDDGRGPSGSGRGWMIAFFALLLLLVVAAVIYLVLIRDSGGGSTGVPSLSPVAVDFGDQDLGQRSAVQAIALENGASDAAHIVSIRIEGQDRDDFSVTDETTCAPEHPVVGGGTCTIGVRFRPKVRADRSATLAVQLAGEDAPLRVELHGTGVGAAAVVLETTRLDLGSVLVGKSRTRTVSITNAGNAPLTITSIALEGNDVSQFKVGKATDCSTEQKLKAGRSCTIAVVFSPKAAGDASATLTIVHDAQGSPSEVEVHGAGRGEPRPELSAESVELGKVDIGSQSKSTSVALTNAGTGPLTLASVTVAGSSPRDFSLGSGTGCKGGLRLDPGDSCTIEVVFAPTAAGDRSATLELRSGTELIGSVVLHGTGVQPPAA